ncbi:MAG: hypothetical protein BWY25_02770 [Chloroflexi bacterium ADurb.Bin222]|nr:MAG: hypothetical protein BWY25_02770 [Chloroflexi bacterium ADurb.Bin222]
MPVEEGVALAQDCNHLSHPLGHVVGIAFQAAEGLLGQRVGRCLIFRPDESCAPGIGAQLPKAVARRAHQVCVAFLLAAHILQRLLRRLQVLQCLRQIPQLLPGLQIRLEQAQLPAALSLVLSARLAAHIFIVARERLEGFIRDAPVQQRGRRPKKAVATLQIALQERKRFAGIECLHPQRHLAEFHRHRVEVHAVDAMPHHIAQRRAQVGGSGFRIARANLRQVMRQPVRRRNQKMPGAARGVYYFDGKEGRFA